MEHIESGLLGKLDTSEVDTKRHGRQEKPRPDGWPPLGPQHSTPIHAESKGALRTKVGTHRCRGLSCRLRQDCGLGPTALARTGSPIRLTRRPPPVHDTKQNVQSSKFMRKKTKKASDLLATVSCSFLSTERNVLEKDYRNIFSQPLVQRKIGALIGRSQSKRTASVKTTGYTFKDEQIVKEMD